MRLTAKQSVKGNLLGSPLYPRHLLLQHKERLRSSGDAAPRCRELLVLPYTGSGVALPPPVPGVHPLPVVRWEFGCSTLLQPSPVQRINEGEAIAGLEAETLGVAGTRLQEEVLANPALFTALKHFFFFFFLVIIIIFLHNLLLFQKSDFFFLFLLLLQPKLWCSLGSILQGNL